MFPKIRWRIAIPYVVLVSLVIGGLSLYVSYTSCITSAACVQRAIWVSAIILAASVVFLALIIAEHITRPLGYLTQITRRIANGDIHARVLPHSRDEVGELTRALNQMTEQLGDRLTRLVEEGQQLSTVLENMADGVLIADEAGFIRLINPGALRILKTTEAAALGRSFAQVVRHHQLIELYRRCRSEAKEQVEAIEIGSDLFLQAAITPLPPSGARGYLIILQDLTQIRRLQTMRHDFISNLSHELRTPLASLRAVIETLQAGALDDPPAAERFLLRAEQEVDTLTQMVEELLELSRIESGQVPLRLAPAEAGDLIFIPLERLRPLAERSNIEINLDLPADLPTVMADADRIRQVVTNLLHNALKFTPTGGKVTVKAYFSADTSEVVIGIKDTGIGISASDLPRIFERFYKSDRARTRSQGGTGLGLAIARHIVQIHQGRIWVKSKEREGSTFYFSLPVSQ